MNSTVVLALQLGFLRLSVYVGGELVLIASHLCAFVLFFENSGCRDQRHKRKIHNQKSAFVLWVSIESGC